MPKPSTGLLVVFAAAQVALGLAIGGYLEVNYGHAFDEYTGYGVERQEEVPVCE